MLLCEVYCCTKLRVNFVNVLVSYINIHCSLMWHIHCCHNMFISWDSIPVPCMVCVSVPFTELHEQHTPNCFCFGTNVYCLPTKYENLICYKVCILLLNQVLCMSFFPLVSYMNMLIHIVLCCGTKRVSFTNNLSEYWCHIINPYLFTKFHTSKHLVKRVTQHACSHCFLLWCENSIVYQQVIRTLVLYQ